METVHFRLSRVDGGGWEAVGVRHKIVVRAWTEDELKDNIELACDIHFSGREVLIVCV